MNILELLKERDSLVSESINFQRAGIDDAPFDHKRDSYVYDRRKEVEAILFPLLTERIVLTFDKALRTDMWQESDKLYYSGYIEVESTIKCDQFNCSTVTGTLTYAKDPRKTK